MAESGELSFYAESDSDSFLTGSVHYSTDNSDYDGASERSISPESEVAPYRFEPEYSELPPISSSSEVDPIESDGLSPDRVGNADW